MCLCQWRTIIQLRNISYRAWFGSTQYRHDSTFDCLGSCCNTIPNPLALGPSIANWPLWHDHQHHRDSCCSNCSRPLTQQVPWRNPTWWALWTTCILLFLPWIDVHPKKERYDNGKFGCRCKCLMGLVPLIAYENFIYKCTNSTCSWTDDAQPESAGEPTFN